MMGKQKSGLIKAATVFATVLLVSVGLCGVNLALDAKSNKYEQLLLNFGLLEILGIAIGVLGLVVVGLIAIFRAITNSFSHRNSDSIFIIEKDKEE